MVAPMVAAVHPDVCEPTLSADGGRDARNLTAAPFQRRKAVPILAPSWAVVHRAMVECLALTG